jgi:hypothetical protein
MSMLRRIRAAVGLAITWGTVFTTVSALVLGVVLIFRLAPPGIFTPAVIAGMLARNFLGGAIAGFIFALLLSRAERSKRVSDLTSNRVAAWGFVGGVAAFTAIMVSSGVASVVPITALLSSGTLYGVICSGLSTATVRVARRAPELPDELLESATPLPQLPS